MTAEYRTVPFITGDGRRVLGYERVVKGSPPMERAPGKVASPGRTGRPRKDDPTTERRRSQYRASRERARHRVGKCSADNGVRCEIA